MKNNYKSLIAKSRILVVDDDPLVVSYITQALEFFGCSNFTALSSSDQSVKFVKNSPVDIILMDVVFQKQMMDGSSAVQEIQKITDVPIIYISGYSGDEILDKIKTTKNAYFLQKPFTIDELKVSIELALFNYLEDSLRKSDNRYRRILDTITDYIYTVKVNNEQATETIHVAACEEMTGYTPAEFNADPLLWILIIPESEREMVREHFKKLLTDHDKKPIEHRVIRKDGKIRWVRDTPVFHFDKDGKLTEYDGIISDITERKMFEEALKAQTESLEELVAQRTEHLELLNAELNKTKDDLRKKMKR